jgi:hypothetical protein
MARLGIQGSLDGHFDAAQASSNRPLGALRKGLFKFFDNSRRASLARGFSFWSGYRHLFSRYAEHKISGSRF